VGSLWWYVGFHRVDTTKPRGCPPSHSPGAFVLAYGWNLSGGSLVYSYNYPKNVLAEPGWRVYHRVHSRPMWLPRVERTLIVLPLWIPFLIVAVLTVFLWWTDRRIPPHCCQNCGYNLTGNVSGICPECGSPCKQTTAGVPP